MFCIGHDAYSTDVQTYKSLTEGGSCTLSYPLTCTAVNVTSLDWYLHGYHKYYVSIKVTNSAGKVKIQTSNPYVHAIQKPSEGVVLDIDTQVTFSTSNW